MCVEVKQNENLQKFCYPYLTINFSILGKCTGWTIFEAFEFIGFEFGKLLSQKDSKVEAYKFTSYQINCWNFAYSEFQGILI